MIKHPNNRAERLRRKLKISKYLKDNFDDKSKRSRSVRKRAEEIKAKELEDEFRIAVSGSKEEGLVSAS